MKILFLDESGDHSLEVIDPEYPLFILGGVLVDAEYAKGEMTSRLNDFKREFLGTDQIILHTADMVRNRNGFERLAQPEFREQFYAALNVLLTDLQYQIIACAIRKEPHRERYGSLAKDPYHFGLEVLVERLYYEVRNNPKAGMIVAEKRDRFLDRQLKLAWLTLKTGGTRFIQAAQVAKHIRNMILQGKEDNIAGLQVADLVVTPIGRALLSKKSLIDYEIIQSKFRCNQRGGYDGLGLVVLPKSERARTR